MDLPQHRVQIPPGRDGHRLDQVLAELMPDYSRSRIKQWILDGQVLLDDTVPEPRTRVLAGQWAVIGIPGPEPADDARAEAMPLNVVYEDRDVLVVDKPAGLVVHPGAGNPAGTLQNGLLAYLPELAELPRSGILHRLDKDTSGLLLIARTIPAHTHLVRDLEARRITREYRAVCVGSLPGGGMVYAPIAPPRTPRPTLAGAQGGRAHGACASPAGRRSRLQRPADHSGRCHTASG